MEDPKKSPYNKISITTVISRWNKQHPKSKFLLSIILCLGLISAIWLSGLLESENTKKINAINQMKDTLQSAQPIITDFYTSLSAYDTGKIDSITAINRLQADKTAVDGLISKMQSTKPPGELQYPYSVTESALQDLSTAIANGIDGIKTDNFQEISQEIDLKNSLAVEFKQAADEVSKLQYPAS